MEAGVKFCIDCPAWREGWCILHAERAAPEDKACGKAAFDRITKSELEMLEARQRQLAKCERQMA